MNTAHVPLNIVTWNATGLMSSCSYICDLLHEHEIDVCGIAEHWLYEKDIHFINNMDNMYSSIATSDTDLLIPSSRRVGKGGVCLLWHKKLDNLITQITCDSDRIIGIQIQFSENIFIFIFQVYLPSSNHSVAKYNDVVFQLKIIVSQYNDKGIVMVMGDMNIDISA